MGVRLTSSPLNSNMAAIGQRSEAHTSQTSGNFLLFKVIKRFSKGENDFKNLEDWFGFFCRC